MLRRASDPAEERSRKVVIGQILRIGARQRGYFDQALHALGLEAARVEPLCLGRLPASP
jgi:hypothetical protein